MQTVTYDIVTDEELSSELVKKTDVQWDKVQTGNGFTVYSNGSLVAVMINKSVTFSSAGATVTLGTLNTNYIPRNNIYTICTVTSDLLYAHITVNGSVAVKSSTKATRTVENIITYPIKSALP